MNCITAIVSRGFAWHVSIFLSIGGLAAQSAGGGKLLIPFLDHESQSNITVFVSDYFGSGQPCPEEYTNVISNSNLFPLQTQKEIREAFLKYRHVSTNSGPAGTILADLRTTNFTVSVPDRTVSVENWVARFQYTNLAAYEEITFSKGGMLAHFRSASNDGYNVSINLSMTQVGAGSLLRYTEVRRGMPNGLFLGAADLHTQGPDEWDFRAARFDGTHLAEYRCYTNGLVLGRLLMWHPKSGHLAIQAQVNRPYDLDRHLRPTP